jgi:hypothetical protein
MPVLIDKEGPFDYQDPADILPIIFDWNPWLASHGLTHADITATAWTVPEGMTKVSEATVDGVSAVLTAGGTLENTYRWACKCEAGNKAKTYGFRLKIQPG